MHPTPAALPQELAPTPAGERLQTLDVVRGFALLGIFLMNIEAMVGPVAATASGLDPGLTGLDRWADAAIYLLVQGKFFTLFSLLFGMGFAVMSQRAERARRPFGGIYLRRGAALLAIGLVHALLIWSGDILVTYALLSFFLLAFRDVPPRWLPWLATACFLGPLLLILGIGLMGTLMQQGPPEMAQAWNEAMGDSPVHKMAEAQRQAFGQGSYGQATLQRALDLGIALMNLMLVGPLVFAMFLLGSWLVKTGAIIDPAAHARLFRSLRGWVPALGLALVLASFALRPTLDERDMNLGFAVAFSLAMCGSALMCLGYLAWIVRGMQSPGWARWLSLVAPAGRMALTNYLMQSVLGTWIFYGYGLGYFEQLGRAWQVPLVLGLFALQVVFSRLWLRRFRFGPMEWLWRSLTYAAPQPMRLQAA